MTIKNSYDIVQHNIRVSRLAERVAYGIGLEDDECYTISIAGAFIDIGKMSMRMDVFNKTRDLTDEEFEYVKQHTTKSVQMSMQVDEMPKEVFVSIIHHHENYDGSGYPDGLVGEDIPIGARILKICDVFYALIEKRAFREDYSKRNALQFMNKNKYQFDPKIFAIFKEIIGSSKIYF